MDEDWENDLKILKKHYELEIKRKELIIERAKSEIDKFNQKLKEIKNESQETKSLFHSSDSSPDINLKLKEEEKKDETNN